MKKHELTDMVAEMSVFALLKVCKSREEVYERLEAASINSARTCGVITDSKGEAVIRTMVRLIIQSMETLDKIVKD